MVRPPFSIVVGNPPYAGKMTTPAAPTIQDKLLEFAASRGMVGRKGGIAVGLHVTDHARKHGLPLDRASLLAASGSQVSGLSGKGVAAILARHGITRKFAAEAGRTNRGTVSQMEAYVAFLNQEASLPGFALEDIETFWIGLVQAFFAAKPLTLKVDNTISLRRVVQSILEQAEERQKQAGGAMLVGTVMQHLVGAKLDLLMGDGVLAHHGANQNDAGTNRGGDFDLGDVAIHVTGSTGEALIDKCAENISKNIRPIIVTGRRGMALAEGLAERKGIAARVEIIELEQFLAANIHEWSRFEMAARNLKVNELIDRYNLLIDEHETDPSLRIDTR